MGACQWGRGMGGGGIQHIEQAATGVGCWRPTGGVGRPYVVLGALLPSPVVGPDPFETRSQVQGKRAHFPSRSEPDHGKQTARLLPGAVKRSMPGANGLERGRRHEGRWETLSHAGAFLSNWKQTAFLPRGCVPAEVSADVLFRKRRSDQPKREGAAVGRSGGKGRGGGPSGGAR